MSYKSKKNTDSEKDGCRILGIDPGYERMGVAVVEKVGNQKETLLFSDCVVTKRKIPHHERLLVLGKAVSEIIKKYKPTVLAIEKLYFNENQKTALLVSEARGAVLFVASNMRLSVCEYTPLEIKVSITGYGRADKKQMTSMVERLITTTKPIEHDDEYDAIATALCCFAYGVTHK
jgi:crossover junction endodeoxyribonuclease RuvC